MFIYIILKIMVPEQYSKREKGNKSTVWLYFIPKNEIILCTLLNMHTLSFQSMGIGIIEISDR